MSDRLKDFVQANRDAFDDREPPLGVWERISKTLPGGKSVAWYDNLLLWRAAAVLFLGLSIYLLIPRGTSADSQRVAAGDFNDVEAFYTTQITQKVALIEEISGSETAGEFTRDFQQLEAMYNVLKEEWKARPSKKVKDALVLNLLVRINLLNQQLHRLEQEDHDEGEMEEKEEGRPA